MILSICIPTYNRKDFLKETIQSILENVSMTNKNNFEICISDNCSTDNTDMMIKEIIQANPTCKISYKINSTNIGADLNYLSVIQMASGKYCWFYKCCA
jgi:abequosyltransferase